MTKPNQILLIYDKDCPACNAYCQVVRIRQSVGELKLINAREDSETMRAITAQGLDIDQGMVLKMADSCYYGSDAIYMLSLLSSRSGVFNRLNYHLFKSRRVAKWLYPLLRACRNLLLKLLRKRKINNLGVSGNDRF
ncbi:DCC1-like thiol-disulfide oxidoreductase family protein [Rheinheimera sp.]|uniref:DCC1-like thiol-disulfide oxidoreductase family protein n=1 Tax=Rheinheimera sp. TaxID=1869214 RepID=UPI0027328C99|nr:DCC1-like thiol-disulfide oxidoreductase family protein [Rheinheimera sp.]MDP2716193.1 DCC1-like thiol-disulfide oxidoreductase family protein [Rheinheimera sp.]